MRPGPSSPFVCSLVVSDFFLIEVFGVLQHNCARKGPVCHGWEHCIGTGLKRAFAIPALWDSLIHSNSIAHLALSVSSLSRKVSATVHDNICQRLSLLATQPTEIVCWGPKRSKSLMWNSSLLYPAMLPWFPVARLGGSQHLWRWLCMAVAHRHWGWCQLGNLEEKIPCGTPAFVTSHQRGIFLDVYCKMMISLLLKKARQQKTSPCVDSPSLVHWWVNLGIILHVCK